MHGVAEAPGNTEVDEGRILAGETGKVVRGAMAAGGLEDDEVSLSNALLCQPPMGLAEYLDKLARDHRRLTRAWELRKADCERQDTVFDAASDPKPELVTPMECCAPRLARDIATVGSKVLLAIGAAALKTVAEVEGVAFGKVRVGPGEPRVLQLKDQCNHPVDLADGRVLMATYHPAFAMHTASAMGRVIEEGITVAGTVAAAGGYTKDEPEFLLGRSADEIINVLDMLRTRGRAGRSGRPRITCDIETTGLSWWRDDCYISCVGLGGMVDGAEVVLVVPIRHVAGVGETPKPYWDKDTLGRIARALRALFDECEIAGHNFIGFDSGKLLRAGLIRNRRARFTDTAILHHDSWCNDLRHDLGFVVGQSQVVRNWKKDADAKYNDEAITDAEMWLYNAYDVLYTMRAVPYWEAQVSAAGNWPQYEVDVSVQTICRNMTELGIPVYEPMRRAMSKMLNRRCSELLADLRHIALGEVPRSVAEEKEGLDASSWKRMGAWEQFNPRSVPQLRDILFDDFALVPPLNTAQEEYSEEDWDDPSTSARALVLMLQKGMGSQCATFIDKLLEHRAHDKLRGTYVDNLPAEDVDWTRWGSQYAWMNGRYKLVHPVWTGWRIPTGRLASRTPNAQNIPSRGRMNIYRMFYAPRGHVFVGADKDQVELRIYTEASGDELLWKAFREGLDPHALNAATMFAERESEVDGWYKKIYAWNHAHCSYCPSKNELCKECKGLKKKAKQLRNIAKRFCIAEGEPVLTDRGLVPIEQVTGLDKVWDGVEWVKHDGVIFKGEEEVIWHEGLWATADHEVWLDDGQKVPHGWAAHWGGHLARTGKGRDHIRYVADQVGGVEGIRTPESRRAVHGVHAGSRGVPGQLGGREVQRLPFVPKTPWDAGPAVELVAPRRRTARVYDLLNAGPRHRFTVSGRLVSNCFLVIYGGGWKKLFETMSTDRDPSDGKLSFPDLELKRVRAWYKKWHERHPWTKQWQDSCMAFEESHGYINTLWMDERKRFGPFDEPVAIPNMRIQGSAGSMMNDHMIRLDEAVPFRGWSPFSGIDAQVHDYLRVVVPEDREEEATRIITSIMNSRHGDMLYSAEAKASRCWATQ